MSAPEVAWPYAEGANISDNRALREGIIAKYATIIAAMESGPCTRCEGSGITDGLDCPACGGYGYATFTIARDELAVLLWSEQALRRQVQELIARHGPWGDDDWPDR